MKKHNDTNNSDQVVKAPKAAKFKTKIEAKLPGGKKEPTSLRITNDNINEHREDILARGRKLKYPMQYSKKRLIIISVVVVVAAVTAFGLWLNNALYKQQQTGDFFFSVTKILPLNVASVDGQPVRYQDYLRRLRADVHYYLNHEHRSFNSEEGEVELNYHKRKDLDVAEKAAYVKYLAEQNNISVSMDEVDDEIKAMREANGETEEGLISTLESYYGWSMSDYRLTTYDQMLEQAVSYAIDDEAKAIVEEALNQLQNGVDFATVANGGGANNTGNAGQTDTADQQADATSKALFGVQSGGTITANTNDQDPTGVVQVVSQLSVGEITDIGRMRTNNTNYYYIARLDAKDGDDIQYSLILVPLTKLDNDFAQLQADGKIKEYISVPAADSFDSE